MALTMVKYTNPPGERLRNSCSREIRSPGEALRYPPDLGVQSPGGHPHGSI